jgi:mutator protein MutT
VAAGLVFRRGKLLIAQRHHAAHLGGLWEFPGGKRQPQESFEQCLARELREELGIEVEVGRMLERVTHAYRDKTVRLEFYHCRWKRHEPRALGCPAFKWITAAELKDYEFPAADAPLAQRLQSSPEWWCW